jgi:[acyl-carrier-protein] S-malonyltransferase
LEDVTIAAPAVPLVSNVRAEPVIEPGEIKQLLIAQVTAPVRWRESVQAMARGGVTEIWEIGAGKALSGMIRRIDRGIGCRTVGTPDEVTAAVSAEQTG